MPRLALLAATIMFALASMAVWPMFGPSSIVQAQALITSTGRIYIGGVRFEKDKMWTTGFGKAAASGGDPTQYRTAGEVASILAALREMAETARGIDQKLQGMQSERMDQSDSKSIYLVLKDYAGINKILFYPGPQSASSPRQSVGLDSGELDYLPIAEDKPVTEAAIRFRASGKDFLVSQDKDRIAMTDDSDIQTILSVLNKNGFTWKFEYEKDGTVDCTLTYRVSEIQSRLAKTR